MSGVGGDSEVGMGGERGKGKERGGKKERETDIKCFCFFFIQEEKKGCK